MKRIASLALAAPLLFGFTTAPQKPETTEEAKKAATVISSDRLKDFLTFIADDSLQGRDTPSPGLDAAANFIAFNLKSWGAKPAGNNGTYFQDMKLERTTYGKDGTKITGDGIDLKYEKDFLVFGPTRPVAG